VKSCFTLPIRYSSWNSNVLGPPFVIVAASPDAFPSAYRSGKRFTAGGSSSSSTMSVANGGISYFTTVTWYSPATAPSPDSSVVSE
jgi:hypothetical protein